ncbi:AT-rich interactive domain-containing protein 5B [Tachysurus vachellii]|uniref:AT-rich interactive domain-containing protein 5B n=1 Tax=Tachysurus vachellii TaxID=175792 RepID=UPI00296B336B|nr:AT-rich interactive domain-containing protein 5B [Tachysurus vachellii]
MEQNAIQWLGPPCCLRGSFAFYKSVSCRPDAGGPVQVWRLGEFYYVRCGPQEPVCIAEITLLWEDQRQRHPLASSRLYYLPEDTPKGRTKEHGEDEVIGVSKKVVVRVEHLVKWTCPEQSQWKHHNTVNVTDPRVLNGSSCLTDPQEVKTKDDVSGVQHRVKVLSYPQYCRFRSLQKRIQSHAARPSPQDPHLLALGWIKMTLHNTRILYCRDTFSHPSLGTNPSLTPEFGCLSVSLKGRPRKRRGRDGDGTDQQILNHSESWGERTKENVMSNVETTDGHWLPHPEEKIFLDQLYLFMERRGSPICKVPNLGFKKIDLFLMYSVVNKLGGYEAVTSRRLWKVVYNELGGSPGSTSAATCTRRHYEKLILPYEQHVKGGNQQLNKPKAPPTPASASIRKAVRGRVQSAPRKIGVIIQAAPPDGARVRKRGRPPGKRSVKVLARGRVGRPSSHTKALSEKIVSKVQPITVIQEVRISPAPETTTHVPQQHQAPDDIKMKQENEPSSPCLLSGQSKLQIGGSLEGFSPTKGMCPMDFFRAHWGLSGVTGPERTQEASITSQTKARSPETPENLQHQCSGCNSAHPSWTGGPREGLTARPQLPPLKILPLDIDCSLQLHQLMHTRIGTAHMNTFTKRLSEALAQDLSKTNGHAVPVSQEQAVPLNLSKKPTTKRSSDDVDSQWQRDSEAKRLKMEPIDLRLTLKQNEGSSGQTLVQDEPADLSCPRRVRALQDRTSLDLTGSQDSHLSPKSDLNPSTDCIFPLSVVSSSGTALKWQENDLNPADLKLGETPERLKVNHNTETCPKAEQLSQHISYKDSNTRDYKVPSLLSKPSKSC